MSITCVRLVFDYQFYFNRFSISGLDLAAHNRGMLSLLGERS
jgi:hypothetical protein